MKNWIKSDDLNLITLEQQTKNISTAKRRFTLAFHQSAVKWTVVQKYTIIPPSYRANLKYKNTFMLEPDCQQSECNGPAYCCEKSSPIIPHCKVGRCDLNTK